MKVESRDSVSLKPAELDEFAQLLQSVGLAVRDDVLDHHMEQFPLVVLANDEAGMAGFMFGSLERIGGTPAILWGLGATRRHKIAASVLQCMTGELARRAAISFPDEDVLVAVRFAQPSIYSMLNSYSSVVPRPGYSPNGEERAWGRRLAKRFGCEQHYDDRAFTVRVSGRKIPVLPVLDASAVKATGGAKVVSLVGQHDAAKGQAMIAFAWAVAEALESGSYAAS
jgi:hypothetical protein